MSMGQKKVELILCMESLVKRRPSMNRAKQGKILDEHLKDRGLFTMNNLSTTFRISKWRVLQGKDLAYKEKTWATRKRLVLQGKEARPHYYKSPNTSSHQGTHNWPLSSTLELWEYFWLNLRRVFGRLHTGAFCKVFLFSSLL